MKPIASSGAKPAPRRRVPHAPAHAGAQPRMVPPPAVPPASRPAPLDPDHQLSQRVSPRATTSGVPVLPAWVLLPLRLFLGVTFAYAGLQKLTDPHYFRPGTPTYIGTQIAAFAHGTPLQGFLLHVALPHAILFGALVAYGELAIGLGTLIGLLMRPAAIFGLILSLTFFLSASWRISPYFYGADIVFVFGWITLLLAGPAAGGLWPALDARLAERALRATVMLEPARRAAVARVLAVVLGVPTETARAEATATEGAVRPAPATSRQPVRRAKGSVTVGRRSGGRGSATLARRDLLRGAALGGGGMLALVWLRSVLFPSPAPTAPSPTQSGAASSTAAATGTDTPAASASGTAASSANVIGQVSQIAPNSAVSFTIPSNQDPGVLVRTQAGSFVAFDATCTHAGCPVQYDPSSQLLICPCHGAEFDPVHNAAVVQGPTDTPLTSVPITVSNATGAITLNS